MCSCVFTAPTNVCVCVWEGQGRGGRGQCDLIAISSTVAVTVKTCVGGWVCELVGRWVGGVGGGRGWVAVHVCVCV